MSKFHINFLGSRRIMFVVSAVLVVISIVSLGARGLTLGVELKGGTVMEIPSSGAVTIEQATAALEEIGIKNASVHTTQAQGAEGLVVRVSDIDPAQGSLDAVALAQKLGLPSDAVRVTIVGPGWGENATRFAVIATVVSLIATAGYMTLRFNYRVAASTIISLLHETIVVVGIYALSGREITPGVIAALLAVLGYSLYDTMVVFNKISNDAQDVGKNTLVDTCDLSLNDLFVRSISTSMVLLVPAACALIFGGDSLKGFAFTIVVGTVLAAYSSIAVAVPAYVFMDEKRER